MRLNLLIAIFTSVFEAIHVNSHEVWKWEMYRLVGEYDQRPGLPAPLVVIELFYKVIKSIWKKTCRRKKENLDLYMQETIENLRYRGTEFLNIPDAYYNQLRKRLKNSKVRVKEDIATLQKLKILIDDDDNGYLLQVGSQNCIYVYR